jgi:mannosyltransferase OCH1-like enzyme
MNRLIKRKLANNRKNNKICFKLIIFLLSCFFLFFVFIIFDIDIDVEKLNLSKKREIINAQVTKIINQSSDKRIIAKPNITSQLEKDVIDFENFNNHDGAGSPIIPNIVHLIFFKTKEISFYQAINIFSIYLNHNPDYIYMHCEVDCLFSGLYWNQIVKIQGLKNKIKFSRFVLQKTIFGQELKNDEQKLDIMKLLILMHYGGIYLDSNVYVVNSLKNYRRFEMVISLEITPNERDRISTQVIISHKNARFLKAWYDSYRTKYSEINFYSSGKLSG